MKTYLVFLIQNMLQIVRFATAEGCVPREAQIQVTLVFELSPIWIYYFIIDIIANEIVCI